MAKSKTDFIKELIDTAQETTWKNELAMEYAKQYAPNDKERDEKVKACEYAITKDKEYITFLRLQCGLLE